MIKAFRISALLACFPRRRRISFLVCDCGGEGFTIATMVDGFMYLSYSVFCVLQCVVTNIYIYIYIVGVPAELTPDQKTLSGLIKDVYRVEIIYGM